MAVVVHGGRAPATITDSHPVADGLRVSGLSLLWCVCQGQGSEVCVRYPGTPHGQAVPSSSGCLFHGTGIVGWGRGETGKQGQFLN